MSRATGTAGKARVLVGAAASLLKQRADEVNRLNVFPVPDGDTGTNMSLTMDTVIRELAALPDSGSLADVCKAVSHGSLMGARGNSGVILSQILRGLCEGLDGDGSSGAEILASALERAVEVSYQAVRKPVEGTMLTVVKDVAGAASRAAEDDDAIEVALEKVATEAYESVRRTPELLPVLKENGVVDAGGYGLAILVEGFVSAFLGKSIDVIDVSTQSSPLMHVEPADDWDDDEYLYCTEFLLFGKEISRQVVEDYVSGVGGSELVVGDHGEFKVHVHTDDPGGVVAYATSLGEVAEVHINNMRRQTAERGEMLREEAATSEHKAVGFVAVAVGDGLSAILKSLGVDRVVNGGQTMNPSTEDLLDAISKVPADAVIVLPNNKNIIMAANAAASVSDRPVSVVPTRSVPAAFAAMLAADADSGLEDMAAAMSEAASMVRTGEVTTAVKDATGKAGAIRAGQVIGIVDDDEIEVVGEDVDQVALALADLLADEAETLSLFAGNEYGDDSLSRLAEQIRSNHPELEIETHRGEQPLYPVIMSAE